jgi:hypothetical protein
MAPPAAHSRSPGHGKLSQQQELSEPTAVQGDQSGDSVAVNALGSELLIGAPYRDNAVGAAWATNNQDTETVRLRSSAG